jgi:hypothetical protein
MAGTIVSLGSGEHIVDATELILMTNLLLQLRSGHYGWRGY